MIVGDPERQSCAGERDSPIISKHHKAWLFLRPHRSPAWLRAQIADGFDVHHIDGDHSNNDPLNLVLVEHTDHMRLHGAVRLKKLRRFKGKWDEALDEAFGEEAYDLYKAVRSWDQVGELKGVSGSGAYQKAKRYAEEGGKDWPLENPRALTDEKIAARMKLGKQAYDMRVSTMFGWDRINGFFRDKAYYAALCYAKANDLVWPVN